MAGIQRNRKRRRALRHDKTRRPGVQRVAKWIKLLGDLDKHVKVDLDYQATKAHDKTCCEAAQRLGGVLVKYMAFYNNSIDCLHQNLQVQKTIYIEDVINAIAARILELINHLRKLEGHRYQFVGNGLIQNLLTFNDSEPKDLLRRIKRSDRLQAVINEVILKANAKMEAPLHEESVDENASIIENKQVINVWEEDESEEESCEVKEILSEESLKRIEMLKLIQAHERSRQVIRRETQRLFKRTMWEKELSGTLKPPARFEMKERAAKLIQNVLRSYFRIKRQRIDQCKVDKMLGMSLALCDEFITGEKTNVEQITQPQLEKLKLYIVEWKTNYEQMKDEYTRKVKDDVMEEHRDVIRAWFRKWYDEANFFYNIPNDEQGGSTLIIKGEVPTPSEWQDQYEAYLEEKKANKNKTSHQKKYEKQEAKREEMRLKKEDKRKLKLEEALMKKVMKNPKMHPGFHYPVSKKTNNIIDVIANYQEHWKDVDTWEIEGYKEGFVKDVDKSNACMNAKMELMTLVDENMRQELKILEKALQTDYKNNNEKMPEMMKKKIKQPKKKRKLKSTITESVQDKLRELVIAGVLKERMEMNFDKFLGEYNYCGDNFRCILQSVRPLGGEIKSLWWEKCNDLFNGAQQFLLVGPHGSGKTTLVHVLASVNDAALFVLDPTIFPEDLKTSAGVCQVVNSVVTCARAVQPSVIHVKCLHLLFCKKAPPGENKKELDMFRQFFVQTVLKKIRKDDLITVVGSCCDPWLTATKKMLKKFSDVILMPDATFSTVSMVLRKWMAENRMVPRNLDIQSVAQVLRGYSFGYVQESLNSFLTPENVVKIAVRGLSPRELLEHITRGGTEERIEYEKYHQWYTENTAWGKKEEKRIQDDKEFKSIAQKYAEKEEKKKSKINKADQKHSEDSFSEI